MYYVHSEGGVVAEEGNSFIINHVKYSAASAKPEIFKALGFTELLPQGREPSHTFYNIQGVSADGQWLKTPWPLDTVQAKLIKDNKTKMLRLLAECDWYVIQAAEGGDAVPAEVVTYRADVRNTFTQRETGINAQTSVDDLYNYVGARGTVQATQPAWPNKPASMFIVEQGDCSVDYDCFCG